MAIEPCTCKPDDGEGICPREAECYLAWQVRTTMVDCGRPACDSPLLVTAPMVVNELGRFHVGCWARADRLKNFSVEADE